MMLRQRLGIAATLGPIVALGIGFALQGEAPGQVVPTGSLDFGNIAMATFLGPDRAQAKPTPGQGNWAEVINVTPSFLIVQDQVGRQFPIAFDRIRQFYVRWPITTDMLNPNSVLEVTGPQPSGNVVIADHADIYEGDAQGLVTPSTATVGNNNPYPFQFDSVALSTFGNAFWLTDEEYNMPVRLHLVGQVLGTAPMIRVGTVDGNAVNVQPSANGMSMTQITIGNPSVPRRGDHANIIPEGASPRSLYVSQMVLYKRVAFRAFQQP